MDDEQNDDQKGYSKALGSGEDGEESGDEENPEHTLDNLEEDELDVAEAGYATDSDLDVQDADDEDPEDE